jgi:hypothetical protein
VRAIVGTVSGIILCSTASSYFCVIIKRANAVPRNIVRAANKMKTNRWQAAKPQTLAVSFLFLIRFQQMSFKAINEAYIFPIYRPSFWGILAGKKIKFI